jgi:hypothetical protein
MMAARLVDAWLGVISALRDVSRENGYHTDVSAVLPRTVLPGDVGAPEMPYLCVELNDQGSYETPDAYAKTKIRIPVIGFVAQRNDAAAETSGEVDALRLHDDIVRAVMPDSGFWLQGSGVDDVDLESRDIATGVPDERGGHIWVQVNFEATVTFDRAVLARD